MARLLLFGQIMLNAWGGFLLTALRLLLAGIPATAALPPVAALAVVVVILAAVAAGETRRYAELRRHVGR
ncbi:hypothetical protein [Streptomyces sp. NPDC057199]|uniref:hypothetical protein n=1 Tax=Streptomyces sp. NPDC057199 TaxID=3346047 RepID=UPI003643D4B1